MLLDEVVCFLINRVVTCEAFISRVGFNVFSSSFAILNFCCNIWTVKSVSWIEKKMTTSLARQLKKLAAPQTTLLKLDKKKPSLLFDPKEAASLDRDVIFDIGLYPSNFST